MTDERGSSRRPARNRSAPAHSCIVPPSPIPGDYGHRDVNKCLAKSARCELFIADLRRVERTIARLIGRGATLIAVALRASSTTESSPARWPAPTATSTDAGLAMRRSTHCAQLALRRVSSASLSSGEPRQILVEGRADRRRRRRAPRRRASRRTGCSSRPGPRSRLRAARAGPLPASVSKKPSCSALVSSWPTGLPPAVKLLRSTASTPGLAGQAEVLELDAEQHEGGGPGFHPVERRRAGCRTWRSPPRAAARLSGGTRSASGGRPARNASRASSPASACGLLLVDDRFDHQASATRRPPCRTPACATA